MQKEIKNKILDLISTLFEAHKHIAELYSQNRVSDMTSLATDCQSCAIDIGNIIEMDKVEYSECILCLQDYCEKLYQIVSVNDNNSIDIRTILDSSLKKVEKSISREIKIVNKVLFIAYYYPPLGGSGVYRSLKFTKYLPDFDWIPTVISAAKPPAGWNFSDMSLVREIPEGTEVFRIPDPLEEGKATIQQVKLNNVYTWIWTILSTDKESADYFGNIMNRQDGFSKIISTVGREVIWSYDVADFIEKKLDITEYDAIFTTSGPYSAHMIGAYFKAKYGIKWIADYRDQWTANPLNEGNIDKSMLMYEKKMLSSSSHNIAVAPLAKTDYIERLKVSDNKISVITNGYDEQDFEGLNNPCKRGDKFVITYSGLLYADSQSIRPVIQAFLLLIKKNYITRESIELRIVGSTVEQNIKFVKENNVGDIVEFKGYVPHRQALQYNIDSDMLLMITGDSNCNDAWIPGKLFDYLRCNRPILALIPQKGDAAQIINSTGHGKVFKSTDIDDIADYILSEYTKWSNKEPFDFFDKDKICRFERHNLTGQLADILNKNIWKEGRYQEFSSEIYDANYRKSESGNGLPYDKHYKQSNYFNSWCTAMRYLYFLDRDTSILEIGCGPGQFAEMLYDNGFRNYLGFDFSPEAVKMAKKNNHSIADHFFVDDAFTTDLLDGDYELVICFEVLEHLRQDLELINRIKQGTKVLLSVPNFNDPNHVRYFDTEKDVRDRYSGMIDIFDVQLSVIHGPYCLFYVSGQKK